jgi:hypothetical protein
MQRDIVLLYCPSKVGSTAITTSIRMSASEKFCVFHTHDETVVTIIRGNNTNKHITVTELIKNTEVINSETNCNRKVYVIDIYRPTIEKRISEYFQDLAEKHFNNCEENINQYDLNKIIKRFNDIFPHMEHKDYYREIYNIPDSEKCKSFDFDSKCQLYSNGGVTYLKLRLIDSIEWSSILSEILNEPIYVIKDYASENKKIGSLYKKFMDNYKIPYNFFRMIELCPQLKYYYTEQEREKYLDTWRDKIINQYVSYNTNEYIFYKNICEENRTMFINSNSHYSDDGCLCNMCKQKRNMNIEYLKNNNDDRIILPTAVNHKYDEIFDNNISLKLWNDDGESYFQTVNIVMSN